MSYNNLWETEFDNIVSERGNLQVLNNQLKLEVHDTNKKDEKSTTFFEAVKNENVIHKAYLGENL